VRGRIRSVTGTTRELVAGWQMCATPPNAFADPAALARAPLEWLPAAVPSTAASALRALGAWSADGPARRFDAEEFWYRARFRCAAAEPGEAIVLACDGLATVADVFLNGAPLLSSHDMFVAHEHRIDGRIVPGEENELAIAFRSLDAVLASSRGRARPRWRVPMIENQQLRWARTTLLGRTPGWSPPAAPVSPWRPIWLERRR
jgi:beta-mannosidase